MSIYEFFNSRDIAEHCRNIGYKFTAIETAYIIWRSNHHTLEEKHKAWQEVINTMPDEKLPFCCWANNSLHNFLHSLMQWQNQFIQEFSAPNGAYIYTISNLSKATGKYCSFDSLHFRSYRACLQYLKQTSLDDRAERIRISKHRLYSSLMLKNEEDFPQGNVAIVLDGSLSLLAIEPAEEKIDADDQFWSTASTVFEEMPIAIPSPFRRGDIVTDVSEIIEDHPPRKPLVLDSFPCIDDSIEEKRGTTHCERVVKAWFQTPDGDVMWMYYDDFLDLEYFDLADDHFLHNMSKHLRGEITTATLLRRHQAHLRRKEKKVMLRRLLK